MMSYINMNAMVRPPDGDPGYFENVIGVLLGNTLGPYMFIICLDYLIRALIDLIKENVSKLKKDGEEAYYTP